MRVIPPDRLWAVGDRGANLKVEVAVARYGLDVLARHAGESKAEVMPRLDTGDSPEIGADLEGMAVMGPRELLLVNDNDFGCERAVTGFWRPRFDAPIFGPVSG